MIAIDVRGMEEVQRALRNLADQQIPYAISTALNSTAFAVQRASKAHIATVFDRPTPFVVSGTRVEKSTKQTLIAKIFIEPKRALVMQWHELGGVRGRQAMEAWLQGKGWLPASWRAIPTAEMPRNQYGNPKPGAVKQIQTALTSGPTGPKSPRRYFVIPVGDTRSPWLKPGIYRTRSRSQGAAMMPLYIFVSRATYQETLDWLPTVEAEARRLLPAEMSKAMQRAIDTAR
jgi:hypothetical protein